MDGLSPAADTDKLTSPNQFIGQLIDATDDCGTRLCGISHGGRDGMKVQAKLVMNFVWVYVDGIFGGGICLFPANLEDDQMSTSQKPWHAGKRADVDFFGWDFNILGLDTIN